VVEVVLSLPLEVVASAEPDMTSSSANARRRTVVVATIMRSRRMLIPMFSYPFLSTGQAGLTIGYPSPR
jgi:hypothetical protein